MGGKPSKGTKKDKRLKENKARADRALVGASSAATGSRQVGVQRVARATRPSGQAVITQDLPHVHLPSHDEVVA